MNDAIRKTDTLEARACHHQRIGRADLATFRQPLHLPAVELTDARVRSAAKMDDFALRKQPAYISDATYRIGTDLESFATRAPQFIERHAIAHN